MTSTRGGVNTDSVWVGTNSVDNFEYHVQYHSITGNQSLFAIFAGNSKIGSKTVGAYESGTWYTRVPWPMSGQFQERTKSYVNGTWYDSWSGQLRAVNTQLKMYEVRIWNTTVLDTTKSPAVPYTTSVQLSDVASIFDNTNTDYTWFSAPAADSEFAQCVPNGRHQFRLNSTVNTLDLTSNCRHPLAVQSSGQQTLCSLESYDETTGDTNFQQLHVLFVPPPGGGFDGWHGRETLPRRHYQIVLSETLIGDPLLDEKIAHELSHSALGHLPQTDPQCNQGSLSNIMCTGDPGRYINQSPQCSDLANVSLWYLTDRNGS